MSAGRVVTTQQPRHVGQPRWAEGGARFAVIDGAPTFQEFVNSADTHRDEQGKRRLRVDHLRDEYISIYGRA